MAIRFDASGDYLTRTANLPSSTAFTLCGWFRRRAAGGATAEILFDIASAGHADYITAYCGAAGANGMYVQSTGGAPTGGTAITDDAWYFAALSCSGTGASAAVLRWAAVGATSFSSVSTAGKSFTLAQISVAGIGDAGFYGNLAAAGMQLYDRALTDAELLAEMNRLTPASVTNLNLWTPMVLANAVKDLSGNGRNWTANGTLTIEDGPPVGWGGRIAVVGQAASAAPGAELAGGAVVGAIATGALTTGAGLAGDAIAGATASGALTTGISAPSGLTAGAVSVSEIEASWDTDVGDDSYDLRFRATATPPSLSTQTSAPWHLERLSQRTRSETGEYKYRYTGDGVRIYIVDTGIRATHDQFGSRVIAGYNGTAGPDTDEDGHGTQVASSSAGSASGTAKGATLVPVKVARATTDLDWTTAYFGGLAWIAANHPAGVRGVVECAVPPPSGGTDGALEAAWQALLDAGLVCVQSAPNDGAETFPRLSAFPSEIIFVGGMGEVDTWSPYSNYGSFIDIAGPAQLLTGLAGIASDSATIDSGGNSNATPMVAGICALLLEENPHATVDRILEILLQQANIGVLSSVPSGTPNVLAYSLATATDWVTHTGVTEPYTIDGLEPDSEYEIEVRRTVDAQTSDWSSAGLAQTGKIVELAGDASGSAGAAGSLTTAIQLAGASVIAATASGAISTGISLAGAAASVTLAGGDLTIQIRMQGDALASAVAAAGLTTAIQLAAAAQAGAQASGDLTTVGAIDLAGDALAAAIAAGDLTVQIRLDGAAVARAIASGVLSTGISVAGAAAVGAAASGSLSTQIALSGAAAAAMGATGSLTTNIRLVGAAIAKASASGDLSGAAMLAGAAIASTLAAGDLSTAIRLAGAALGGAQATGALTAPGAPASLAADAQAIAIAEGGLTTSIRLEGAAASVVQATGSLDVGVTMQASAFASAMASGVLLTQIRLDADAVAGALAAATLSVGTAEHGARVLGWRGANRQTTGRLADRQTMRRPRQYG